MSQIERDDYDDEPIGKRWIRNPKFLKWAGMLWLIAWGFQFLGNICVFGPRILSGISINEFGWFIANLFIGGLYLLGAYLARKGKSLALVLVAVFSSFGVLLFGLWGILIGLNMMNPYGPPGKIYPKWQKVLGGVVFSITVGFILFSLLAFIVTVVYAIKKKPLDTTPYRTPPDNSISSQIEKP